MVPGQMLGPGFFGQALRELTPVGSTTSSASTIAWPAGVQAGDIAILVDHGMALDGNPSDVVPGNMTKVDTSTDSVGTETIYYVRRTVSRRICTGSESGTITGINASGRNRKTLTVLRPNWSAGYGAHVGTSVTMTASNPGARSVSPGANAAPLISIGSKFSENSGALSMSSGTGGVSHQVLGGSVSYDTAFKFMLNPGEEQAIGWDAGGDGAWNFLAATLIRLT